VARNPAAASAADEPTVTSHIHDWHEPIERDDVDLPPRTRNPHIRLAATMGEPFPLPVEPIGEVCHCRWPLAIHDHSPICVDCGHEIPTLTTWQWIRHRLLGWPPG